MTDAALAWLRAQLDDDERVARAAIEDGGLDWWCPTETVVETKIPADGDILATASVAWHIATWDPARVLAEIAAKRSILDAYDEAKIWYDQHRSAPAGEVEGLWTAIKAIAQPYVDRPGFPEEWRA